MKKMSHSDELLQSILILEAKQIEDKEVLMIQFRETYEELKPVNFIKNTFDKFLKLPDLKENILDTSISLAAGFLSKKVLVGSSHNPIKHILGNLMQMGVAGFVSKKITDFRSTDK